MSLYSNNRVILRDGRNRSHSAGIEEDEEIEMISDVTTSDDCLEMSATDDNRSNSLALSHTREMSIVRRVGEVERRERLRKKKRNQKRATVIITSGAMTFIVMTATLVTVTFLMSPVFEEIFGQ